MKKFEHGKVYRFMPTKAPSFLNLLRNGTEYTNDVLWELDIKDKVFMYKGKKPKWCVKLNGFDVLYSWCEEVK